MRYLLYVLFFAFAGCAAFALMFVARPGGGTTANVASLLILALIASLYLVGAAICSEVAKLRERIEEEATDARRLPQATPRTRA